MHECCRQSQAEVISNNSNKIQQTWGPPFSQSLYIMNHDASTFQIYVKQDLKRFADYKTAQLQGSFLIQHNLVFGETRKVQLFIFSPAAGQPHSSWGGLSINEIRLNSAEISLLLVPCTAVLREAWATLPESSSRPLTDHTHADIFS